MTEHISELALELARTGEATIEEQAHLESCPECQERLRLFAGMASGLRLSEDAVSVPLERDASMMAMIGAQAERIREAAHPKARPLRRWIPAGIAASVAAAAAVALLVVSPRAARDARPSTPVAASAVPDDLNNDGRVDILDAFQLARQLQQGGRSAGRDTADVNRIAALAVSLKRSPR